MNYSFKTTSDESLSDHHPMVSEKISFAGVLIHILFQLAFYKEFYVNKYLFVVEVSMETKCKKNGIWLELVYGSCIVFENVVVLENVT